MTGQRKHSSWFKTASQVRHLTPTVQDLVASRPVQRDGGAVVMQRERRRGCAPRQFGIPKTQFWFCGCILLRSVPKASATREGRGHVYIGLPGCRPVGKHGKPVRRWYGFGPHEAGRATIHLDGRGLAMAGHVCQFDQLYQNTFLATQKSEHGSFDRVHYSLLPVLDSGAPRSIGGWIFSQEGQLVAIIVQLLWSIVMWVLSGAPIWL